MLAQVVNLASNLLPPLPEVERSAAAAASSGAVRPAADRSEAAIARSRAAATENAARVSFLAENPALLQSFAQSLLPLMLQVRRNHVVGLDRDIDYIHCSRMRSPKTPSSGRQWSVTFSV